MLLKLLPNLFLNLTYLIKSLMDWGPEYNVVHTSIANRKSPISFEELFSQLLTFEPRLELHNATSIITTPLYTSTSHGRSVLMDGLLTVVVILPPTLVVALFLNPLHIKIPIPLHLHVKSVIALGTLPLIVSIGWISLSKGDNHERNSRLWLLINKESPLGLRTRVLLIM